jgi:hypothetical protein
MKKVVLNLVLSALFACASGHVFAASMTMSVSPTRPDTNGGYFWDNGQAGGRWSNYTAQWGDVAHARQGWMEVFKLANSQTLSGYAFQLDAFDSVYAGGTDNLVKLELWDLSGNRVAAPSAGNTLLDSWTGTLDSALNGQGFYKWFNIALSNTKTLNAGTMYGLTLGWVNQEFIDQSRKIRPYVDQNYIQHPTEPQLGGNPPNRTTSSRIDGDPTSAGSYSDVYYNPNFALIAASVPEPTSLCLLSVGALCLFLRRRR